MADAYRNAMRVTAIQMMMQDKLTFERYVTGDEAKAILSEIARQLTVTNSPQIDTLTGIIKSGLSNAADRRVEEYLETAMRG